MSVSGPLDIREGDAGTTTLALFTVTLSRVSAAQVTVDWTTVGGSAEAPGDYVPSSGTLVFSPGQTSRTIPVMIVGDNVVENNEIFSICLSNQQGAEICPGYECATATIVNDDGSTISVEDAPAVTESDAGTTPAVFQVKLSRPSATPVTVDWATADANPPSALADDDYCKRNGTVIFAPNETSQTIEVCIVDDDIVEPIETFLVNLSNPAGATISDGQGVGTIVDDDQTEVSISDAPAVTEGDAGTTKPAVFTVTLTKPSATRVAVNWATANTNPTSVLGGTDYDVASGTVDFPPGEKTRTLSVTIRGDDHVESDGVVVPHETFLVKLSNPNPSDRVAILRDEGVGTIVDDDRTCFSISGPMVNPEGDAGATKQAEFIVTLSKPSASEVKLNWATADGTATAPDDYVAANGVLTFSANSQRQTIPVTVKGDNLVEDNEDFFVNLSNPVGLKVDPCDDQGKATIVDDDQACLSIVAPAAVTEGDAGATTLVTFTVGLSKPIATSVTVDWSTVDGSGKAGDDYVAASGTLTLPANSTDPQSIQVTVKDDNLVEREETFAVCLSNPSGAPICTDRECASIRILDNDQPQVSISDAAAPVEEGDIGTTKSTVFTVTLSEPSPAPVTVDWATKDGTAEAGKDYIAANGTVAFPANSADPRTIQVTVIGDNLDEDNESFFVKLSNPVGATINHDEGVGTIKDDDVAQISISDPTVEPEGDTGTTPAVFTVTLTKPSATEVKVNWATVNGTATAPDDYIAASGLVTFLANSTAPQSISVTVNGDNLVEGNETFFVNLSNPVGAPISKGQGVGTIKDDDVAQIVISDATATPEGDAGATPAVFTATLTKRSATQVTVNWATANGTATDPGDYIAASGTMTFEPDDPQTQAISIAVNGDKLVEEVNENFFVNLSNPVGATISDGQGVGTIVNNDLAEVGFVMTTSTAGESTGGHLVTIRLTLPDEPLETPITMRVTDAGTGAATAGTDYAPVGTVLVTFPIGSPNGAQGQFILQVLPDNIDEFDETVVLSLTAQSGPATINPASHTVTIGDDDATPTISVNNVSAQEGNAGNKAFTFQVTLSGLSEKGPTVNYATDDGTAETADDDYIGLPPATLSWGPNDLAKPIVVQVRGDNKHESNETFRLELTGPVNATLSVSPLVATGTIENDDPVPTVSIADASVTEGNAGTSSIMFDVALSNPSDTEVRVDWATANDNPVSAEAGIDYVADNGTVVFPANSTGSQTIQVTVNGDNLVEGDETFLVILSNPVGATIDDGEGVGTIEDDD